MTFRFRALGTLAVVAVVDPQARDDALAAVTRELATVDATYSRFREDSELTRVVRARGRAQRISPLLVDAVAAALDAAAATGGLVDPTVGRTLRLAGYDATFRVVATRDGDGFRAAFERVPGWRVVELDRAAQMLRVPEGVELDLGSVGKALAADRAATRAAAAAGCGVLVSLGGDVAIAGAPPDGGWAVGIAHDQAAPDSQQTVAIHSGGVATSSTAVRTWRSGDRILHHLIDPRTGRPAETCWQTVSVAAASCVDANTASTAAIVMGASGGSWLEQRALDARLVAKDGGVATTGRWPAAVAA